MADLITSLDLMAATGTLIFLARAVTQYALWSDPFASIERLEKRSLLTQRITRRN